MVIESVVKVIQAYLPRGMAAYIATLCVCTNLVLSGIEGPGQKVFSDEKLVIKK